MFLPYLHIHFCKYLDLINEICNNWLNLHVKINYYEYGDYMENNKDITIDLVLKAQQGDSDAFGELYMMYKDNIYFYAIKLVKKESNAEDVVQDTIIEMYKSINSLKNPEYFKTWIISICHNICCKYFKKSNREIPTIDDDNSFIEELSDDDESVIPGELLESEEFRNIIDKMINKLPEQQRAVLILYYYNDMSVSDIAEVLGCPTGTVKSNLNYGRKKIKASVDEYEDKNNIKLHSVGVGPLFVWLFRQMGKNSKLPNSLTIYQTACSATGVAASVATVATLSTSIAAATTTTIVSTGILSTLAAKVVIGAVAISVVTGGTVAVVSSVMPNKSDVQSTVSLEANENAGINTFNNNAFDSDTKSVESDNNSLIDISSSDKQTNILNPYTMNDINDKSQDSQSQNSEFTGSDPYDETEQVMQNSSVNASEPSTENNTTSTAEVSSIIDDSNESVSSNVSSNIITYPENTAENIALFNYTVNGDYITITKYNGADETILVPSIINDIPVKEIAGNVFYSQSSVSKKIVIPYGVISINSYAFGHAYDVDEIDIPNSVTSIGSDAFDSCSSLKSITIPDSVTSMGTFVFSNCSSLSNVTLSKSITGISNGMFSGCSSLKYLYFPDNITGIGSGIIYGCSDLTISFPSNDMFIGLQAFAGCSNLTKVYR